MGPHVMLSKNQAGKAEFLQETFRSHASCLDESHHDSKDMGIDEAMAIFDMTFRCNRMM